MPSATLKNIALIFGIRIFTTALTYAMLRAIDGALDKVGDADDEEVVS